MQTNSTAEKTGTLAQPRFVPMSASEMSALGWDALDVLLINGDAYVDHPSCGVVLLARWLIWHGFRTGIVAQPRWKSTQDLLVMGRPRLFVGVSAGALDSLLAHYTAFRKKRHDDAYTPGGKAGARPNRACLVYANLARQAFPGVPVVLGGIEASLRRVTHYDFWINALRRPILMDAKADLLIWGMGERAIVDYARRLEQGADTHGIAGTAWMESLDKDGQPASLPSELADQPGMALPSHESIVADAFQLLRLTQALERHVHRQDMWAFQPVGQRALVLAPPALPLSTAEMDLLYGLPFTRRAHPAYALPIPAEEMLRTSITSHRGCGGGCTFCSLSLHQGRRISSRSAASLLAEAQQLGQASLSRGKGPVAISDVGGPTANMWQGRCAREHDRRSQGKGAVCRRNSCCFPAVCPWFVVPQHRHVQLLRAMSALAEVKQVRLASGIRADLALRDKKALAAYAAEFTGGQLKVAPEHCVPAVLEAMRKPALADFEAFLEVFYRESRAAGREYYVVPYLMSAFPGCTDEDMRVLARWLRQRHWHPRQTQCFIPTPGTLATAMFYCQCDAAGNPLYVARSDAERLRQHRILMGASLEAQGKAKRKTTSRASSPLGGTGWRVPAMGGRCKN
ncbi:MAG: YgiQ family radical SAM protein [Desulfovibrio sp.]|nr:YgiQ family radical SAM protein [Desulfovibrio sp.]